MKSNHEYRIRMQFLKRWNNEIKQKKFSDRNFDVIFRLMLLIYGENMKKCVKMYVEQFKKFHDKKQIFATCSEN